MLIKNLAWSQVYAKKLQENWPKQLIEVENSDKIILWKPAFLKLLKQGIPNERTTEKTKTCNRLFLPVFLVLEIWKSTSISVLMISTPG